MEGQIGQAAKERPTIKRARFRITAAWRCFRLPACFQPPFCLLILLAVVLVRVRCWRLVGANLSYLILGNFIAISVSSW